MKKRFAMILLALIVMSGAALAESDGMLGEITFEMFAEQAGIPYEGQWTCFDDTVYFYLPIGLPQAEITGEMRADGVLACYEYTDEQGAVLQIQIAREAKKKTVETVLEEYRTFCIDVARVKLNGMPAVVALYSNESQSHVELYAQAFAQNGASYRLKVILTGKGKTEDADRARRVLGMLCSFSEKPLEMDFEKAGTQSKWQEREDEEVSEPMSSVITLQFTFGKRADDDLDQINQMLSVMELTDVEIDAFEGYLATREKMEEGIVVETSCRYGFDSCTLICRKAEWGQTHRYQIATEVIDAADAVGHGDYAEYWRERYPQRKLETVIALESDEYTAYIVVYVEPDEA